MSDLNTLTISGRLTADPAARGGGTVAALSIASNRQYQSNGAWVNEALFIDATAFGFAAKKCIEHLQKADHVTIVGRLELNEWEAQDGSKRRAIRVVVNSIESPAFQATRWQRVEQTEGTTELPVSANVEEPVTEPQLVGVTTGAESEDDIPF